MVDPRARVKSHPGKSNRGGLGDKVADLGGGWVKHFFIVGDPDSITEILSNLSFVKMHSLNGKR